MHGVYVLCARYRVDRSIGGNRVQDMSGVAGNRTAQTGH
jgi:hypothetical protein